MDIYVLLRLVEKLLISSSCWCNLCPTLVFHLAGKVVDINHSIPKQTSDEMDNPGLDSALDEKRSSVPDGGEPDASSGPTSKDNVAKIQYDHSFQNIVRNFTPS